jgi:hypothetical protein
MKEINKILNGIYDNPELRKECVPLFLGNPGLGKTSIIRKFAEEKNVKCLTEIASTKMPHEFVGVAIPDHSTKRMTYFDYDALLELKDGDILFFDEMLNANTMILNAFLNVLEDRTLPSGKKLADIMIVAAANPQGATIITPQIKERFIWYDIKFDRVSWKHYMSKFLITDSIYDQLCVLIQNETFNSSDKNFYTPRSIVKAIKMMINDIPTPYSSKLSPILNNFIENTSGQDMLIGDYIFKANENISWLNLQKMIKNANTTK